MIKPIDLPAQRALKQMRGMSFHTVTSMIPRQTSVQVSMQQAAQ